MNYKGKLQALIELKLQEIIVDFSKSLTIKSPIKFRRFIDDNNLHKGICYKIHYQCEPDMKQLILKILNDYKNTNDFWYDLPSFLSKECTIKTRIEDLKQIRDNLPPEWKLKWMMFKTKFTNKFIY